MPATFKRLAQSAQAHSAPIPIPSPSSSSMVPRNDGGVCQPELVTRKALTYFRRSMAAAAISSLSPTLYIFIFNGIRMYAHTHGYDNTQEERER